MPAPQKRRSGLGPQCCSIILSRRFEHVVIFPSFMFSSFFITIYIMIFALTPLLWFTGCYNGRSYEGTQRGARVWMLWFGNRTECEDVRRGRHAGSCKLEERERERNKAERERERGSICVNSEAGWSWTRMYYIEAFFLLIHARFVWPYSSL